MQDVPHSVVLHVNLKVSWLDVFKLRYRYWPWNVSQRMISTHCFVSINIFSVSDLNFRQVRHFLWTSRWFLVSTCNFLHSHKSQMQTPASNIKISWVVITFHWYVCLRREAFSTYLLAHINIDVWCTDTWVRSKRQIRPCHQLRKPRKFHKLFIEWLFYAEFAVRVT